MGENQGLPQPPKVAGFREQKGIQTAWPQPGNAEEDGTRLPKPPGSEECPGVPAWIPPPPPGGWLGKGTRQPGRCSRPPQVSRLHPPQASRLCEGPGRTMKLSRTGGSGANGRGAHAHSHAHARTRCPASPTHRQRGFPRASPLHWLHVCSSSGQGMLVPVYELPAGAGAYVIGWRTSWCS